MGAPEDQLKLEYISKLGPTQRRFFIDAGTAWKSDKHHTFFIKEPGVFRVLPGDIVLRHPQKFQGGPVGWFDAAGWDEVLITPDMVGKTVAIFAGDELKTKNDRLSKFQKILGTCLARMGGRWREWRG